MEPRAAYRELLRRVAEICDLSSASALLSWDQETTMPKQGAPARARQLATVAGIRHERFVDGRVGELLADCEAAPGQFEDVERTQLRELRHDWDRATKLPRALVEETASAESSALEAWRDARAKSDWKAFAPHVRQLMGYAVQRAQALGFTERPYDGMLDDYERGADEERLDALFSDLRPRLTPMIGPVLERRGRVDSACVRRPLAIEKQAEFGLAVIRAMGFDLDAGRVDLATHPFCSGIGPGDTRLTRRYDLNDLRPALYGIVHEAGHGLYEQGLAPELRWTPLGSASSLGIHESQSRLWENVVGRSRPFWERFLPDLRRLFPSEFRDVTADQMYRAVNEVATSLIRVEADELTYNLHVLLRFEIERALFAGNLDVDDVPAAWGEKCGELLGVRPKNDAEGCLQDIHWSMGAFGYFPTYTLGNLYAAQLYEAAQRDLGDLDGLIAHGEFAPLREWLRAKIHRHGRRFLPAELVFRATGADPSAEPFLRYLRAKLEDVYGI
ncbi:MAG TPA: carboxypeptidase M32 [Planctomycetota bacterium]|nr:carboxypeptidase M32 [Planctomycetota bacterium]